MSNGQISWCIISWWNQGLFVEIDFFLLWVTFYQETFDKFHDIFQRLMTKFPKKFMMYFTWNLGFFKKMHGNQQNFKKYIHKNIISELRNFAAQKKKDCQGGGLKNIGINRKYRSAARPDCIFFFFHFVLFTI